MQTTYYHKPMFSYTYIVKVTINHGKKVPSNVILVFGFMSMLCLSVLKSCSDCVHKPLIYHCMPLNCEVVDTYLTLGQKLRLLMAVNQVTDTVYRTNLSGSVPYDHCDDQSHVLV